MRHFTSRAGFTLIELLLVIGIISLLFSISTILIGRLIPRANVTNEREVILADLQLQQLKAMSGATDGSAGPSRFGIRFDTNQYILFKGSSYNAADTANVVIPVESPLQLSTTFPNQSIVFEPGSGAIANFSASGNTVTIGNSSSTEASIITLNQYGILE